MANVTPLSELIDARMTRRKLSNARVADDMVALGLPISRISILRYRRGEMMPSSAHGKALCRVLGISASNYLDAAELQLKLQMDALARTSKLKRERAK